jgi:uncharacterized DUF497 family protein
MGKFSLRYQFEWDPAKARENVRKHKVSFQRAATIFRDPNALSIFDQDHSQEEDRWLTLGRDSSGNLMVVCHTYRQSGSGSSLIRIISARQATKKERQQYEDRRT